MLIQLNKLSNDYLHDVVCEDLTTVYQIAEHYHLREHGVVIQIGNAFYSKFTYVNGYLHGPAVIKDHMTNIEKYHYFSHGMIQGYGREIRPGISQTFGPYVNNQKHGEWRAEYNHGMVVVYNMKYGAQSGKLLRYDKKGYLCECSEYLDGCLHGRSIFYNELGHVTSEYTYFNNEYNGKVVYKNRRKVLETVCDSLASFTTTRWYNDGSLFKICTRIQEKLCGPWLSYYKGPGQRLREQQFYINGHKHGDHIKYDRDGREIYRRSHVYNHKP